MNTQQATILQQLLDKIEDRTNLPKSAKMAMKYFTSKSAMVSVAVGAGNGQVPVASNHDAQKALIDFEANQNLFLNQLEKDGPLRDFLRKIVSDSVFPARGESGLVDFDGSSVSVNVLASACLCFDLVSSFKVQKQKNVADQFWLHTIRRSLAARSIARRISKIDSGVVFSTSTFFGLGRIALLAQLKESYIEFLEKSKKQNVSVLSMELASLGFDHRVIGAKLLQKWNGPAISIEAILAAQGDADESLEENKESIPELTRILLSAEMIARSQAPEGSFASTEVKVDREELGKRIKKLIGIADHVVDFVIQSTDKPVRQLAKALKLNLPDEFFPAPPAAKPEPSRAKESTEKKPSAKKVEKKEKPKKEVAQKKAAAPKPNPPKQKVTQEKTPPIEKAVDKKLSELDQQFKKWQDEEEGRQEEPDEAVHEVQKWTGDRKFTGTVAAALRVCKEQRKELGLVLLEIDHFEDLLFSESVEDIYQIQKKVRVALEALAQKEGGMVSEISDERFGVTLPQRDLNQTARFGKTALQLLRSWSAMRIKEGYTKVTFSIGSVSAAFLTERTKPLHLIQGAQRCLGAVKLQSGNGHKSISLLS